MQRHEERNTIDYNFINQKEICISVRLVNMMINYAYALGLDCLSEKDYGFPPL